MSVKKLHKELLPGIDREIDSIAETVDVDQIDKLSAEMLDKPNYADIRFKMAHLLFLSGSYEEALQHLEKGIELNPRYADAYRLRGLILLNQGHLEPALTDFNHLLTLEAPDAETHYRRASLLTRMGRLDEAKQAANAACQIEPRLSAAWSLLGELAIREHDWSAAITALKNAQNSQPSEEYYYLLGLLHLKIENIEQAEHYFDLTLEAKPNHLNACVRQAVIKLANTEYERGYQLIKQALQYYPNYPDLHFHLAKVCMVLGKPEEAADGLQRALQINPKYADAIREVGFIAHNQHLPDKALAELERSLELNPEDVNTILGISTLKSQSGNLDGAIELLEKSIRQVPGSWRLYNALGMAHLQRRSQQNAKKAFSQAYQINPELDAMQQGMRYLVNDEHALDDERKKIANALCSAAEKNHRLGILHLDYHREKQAVPFFIQSMNDGYENHLNAMLLSIAYANMQKFDLAISSIQELSMQGMAERSRKVLLGLYLANDGDHQRALRCYHEAMTNDPLYFHSLNAVPVCFREHQELDDMLDDYQDYLRYHPNSPELNCRIGELFAQKGMLVDGRKHFWTAAVHEACTARAFHSLGLMMMMRMDMSYAVDSFLRAVEKQPDWALPHLNLALIYHSQGRNMLAASSLKKFCDLEQTDCWRDAGKELLEKIKGPLTSQSIAG